MTNFDVSPLAQQKATLLRVINIADKTDQEHLQGLLHWIDALQDRAVADGYPVVWMDKLIRKAKTPA